VGFIEVSTVEAVGMFGSLARLDSDDSTAGDVSGGGGGTSSRRNSVGDLRDCESKVEKEEEEEDAVPLKKRSLEVKDVRIYLPAPAPAPASTTSTTATATATVPTYAAVGAVPGIPQLGPIGSGFGMALSPGVNSTGGTTSNISTTAVGGGGFKEVVDPEDFRWYLTHEVRGATNPFQRLLDRVALAVQKEVK
jgi:hypothetical protein